MNIRASNWLPLLLLALLAGATFWLASTVTGIPNKGDGSSRHDPDMIVETFTAKQFGENGQIHYTLAARKMIHYPDDDTSHLTDVKFQSFEPGNPPLHATADTALLTQKGDEVFLRGNVIMIREAGPTSSELTLHTNYLHLIPDSGIAKTDQPLVLKDTKSVINAASMVANHKNQTMTLTRVNATYETKK
ncbi:MAG: LPS export ABC transporter periplasmic protein LptC [Pseudomonadota bacterium]